MKEKKFDIYLYISSIKLSVAVFEKSDTIQHTCDMLLNNMTQRILYERLIAKRKQV